MPENNEAIVRTIAEVLKHQGFPWQAKYILKFGTDMEPNLSRRSPDKTSEKFYRKCVEEGHPWDWYHEYPEEAVF